MHKKKNIRLIGILTGLIALIILIEVVGTQQNNLRVDKKMFQLDPNTEINKVVLSGPVETNQFDFRDGRWRLNDSLLLDQSMRDVFFSIVSQLEVRRPVLAANSDSIAALLSSDGVRTSIRFADELIQQYWIGGNSEEQVSWAMGMDRQPYQVHIPGYQSYVAGIYSVPATDWRSRFLLDVNFALIRTISIDHLDSDDDLELRFANSYFSIPGVEADSSKIADFLETLSFLQANNFISQKEQIATPDEAHGQALAILTIETLDGNQVKIEFFETSAMNQFIIAKLADGSSARIDRRRLAGLLINPEDFE